MNFLNEITDNEDTPPNTRPDGDQLTVWKQNNTLRGWQALWEAYAQFSLVERQKGLDESASKWANHANDCQMIVQCLQAGRDPTEAIAHYQHRLENWYNQLAKVTESTLEKPFQPGDREEPKRF